MSASGIKSMKLYSHLERITKELAAAGIDPDGPLTVAQLSPFDNLHYHGTEAVEQAVVALGLNGDSMVAEVGSGIGGPARYMAERSGCHVTALELQPDLNALAEDLTRRCGLAQRVIHLCGDVLDGPLAAGAFDAVVSWLALYHIADRAKLFPEIAKALKPSGRIFIEDISSRGEFTEAELELLRVKLYGQCTPSLEAYGAELARAGFTDIQMTDMSDDWADFTRARLAAYRDQRARHERVHGPETVAAIEEFYDAVDRLFQGGNLGGIRVTARKA
ncbi:MAG: methyltransferase domain-containing protein [Pseudomonadota bacterium]